MSAYKQLVATVARCAPCFAPRSQTKHVIWERGACKWRLPPHVVKQRPLLRVGKTRLLNRSSPSFVIYQCQRDFVGSLEDAEKRRQLDSWNCRRLGHPRTTCKHQRGCVLQSGFSKKSLEKAAQIKVADSQAVQEFTILSQ